MSDVTPVLLSYNEEANLARTLDALAWADDIVLVDSFSTDATLEIAARYRQLRVFRRRFDSHAAQWNFAISQTEIETDWILALDADYVAPSGLCAELARACADKRKAGYSAGFRYCVFGRPLRGSLYPPHVVLFRRGRGRFRQCGHTQRLEVTGEIGALASTFDHDDRKPLSRWVEAQMRYARLEVEHVEQPGTAPRLTDRLRRTGVVSPFLVLFHALFVRGLVRDGWAGWYYGLQRMTFEILFCLAWVERAHFVSPSRLGGEKGSPQRHEGDTKDAKELV